MRRVDELVEADHRRRVAFAVKIDVVVIAMMIGEVTIFNEDVGKARVDSLANGDETAVGDICSGGAGILGIVGDDRNGVAFACPGTVRQILEQAVVEIYGAGDRDNGFVIISIGRRRGWVAIVVVVIEMRAGAFGVFEHAVSECAFLCVDKADAFPALAGGDVCEVDGLGFGTAGEKFAVNHEHGGGIEKNSGAGRDLDGDVAVNCDGIAQEVGSRPSDVGRDLGGNDIRLSRDGINEQSAEKQPADDLHDGSIPANRSKRKALRQSG